MWNVRNGITRIWYVAVSLCVLIGCGPTALYAATTYDFNADTAGQAPANTVTTAGSFQVTDFAPLGYSLRAMTQTGSVAGIVLSNFASSTDYMVTWKQAYSNALARGGFLLRAQSEFTSLAAHTGLRQGYLFQLYDTGSYYIWKLNSAGFTQLATGSLTKASPRWYKAVVLGNALGFYYSDDGTTYTSLASTTDSTYSSGVVQYSAGYGLGVTVDYVDDITHTLLGSDTTPPTVSVTSPSSGNATTSIATLAATASDNTAVAGVTFYVNGTRIGSEDTSSPYSLAWDTTATTSGSKSVAAVARDTANNYATSTSVAFTVDNDTPTISINGSNPATVNAGATYSDAGATASDATTGDLTSSITTSGTVNTSLPGSYSITYSVTDSTGHSASATRTVTVRPVDGGTIVGLIGSTGGGYKLPGYVESRPQIIKPDGSVTYTDTVDGTKNGAKIVAPAPAPAPALAPAFTPTPALVLGAVRQSAQAAPETQYTFARTLKLDMTGDDVRQLQQFLNSHGSPLSNSGVGSQGNETNYFGQLTFNALKKFQEMHAVSILSPLQLTEGTGIFGELTISVVHSMK